jgi:CBS domain-containing protein
MRDVGIGDVIVEEDGQVCGIVTDRDITVRVVAEAVYPNDVALGDICSRDLTAVAPTDSVEEAAKLMSHKRSTSFTGRRSRPPGRHRIVGRSGP